MSYSIGIGALVDGKTFNRVRSLELAIAAATGNYSGLGQPPHITIKRPFLVESIDDIAKIRSIITDIASTTPPFSVPYTGLSNFDSGTLFLAAGQSQELEILHEALLSRLQTAFGAVEAPHEGKKMAYHTTIALGLKDSQLQQLTAELSDNLPESCTIGKCGIFLGLDNTTHWSVISEVKLA